MITHIESCVCLMLPDESVSRSAHAVLREQAIVQHALRQTLVADALTLQLKLPPAGVPAPVSRSSPTVAGGAPVVDVLAVTSVWAVHILRSLSQVTA